MRGVPAPTVGRITEIDTAAKAGGNADAVRYGKGWANEGDWRLRIDWLNKNVFAGAIHADAVAELFKLPLGKAMWLLGRFGPLPFRSRTTARSGRAAAERR